MNQEHKNHEKLPEFNEYNFRFFSVDVSGHFEKLTNSCFQFLYKGYEISTYVSKDYKCVLVAIFKDDTIVGHTFTVEQAIIHIDKIYLCSNFSDSHL